MPNNVKSYYHILRELTKSVIVTGQAGGHLDLSSGIDRAVRLIIGCGKRRNKIFFIGNGASAAMSSHMAVDFWKNGKIRAIAFNDAVLLTCISNDFGYKKVFRKPIEMFGDADDILIAISSSGRSENILQAVAVAKAKGMKVITLSGFSKNNPLRKLGIINFYVPSSCYGHVEVLHHSICHCLLDNIVYRKNKGKITQ